MQPGSGWTSHAGTPVTNRWVFWLVRLRLGDGEAVEPAMGSAWPASSV